MFFSSKCKKTLLLLRNVVDRQRSFENSIDLDDNSLRIMNFDELSAVRFVSTILSGKRN